MDLSKIDKYILIGQRDRDWYSGTERTLRELFGDERLPMIARLLAATSINSSLRSNVRLFRKALHEMENGLEFSNYLPVILGQLHRIRAGLGLSGRKINAFANAIMGDTQAVVVDVWLLRAFGMDRQYKRTLGGRERSGGATDKQFSLIEDWVRARGPQIGLEPRQLSAILWAGTRIHFRGDKLTRYDDVLRQQCFNMYENTNRR